MVTKSNLNLSFETKEPFWSHDLPKLLLMLDVKYVSQNDDLAGLLL